MIKAATFIVMIFAVTLTRGQLVTTIAGGGNGDGGQAVNTSMFETHMAVDGNNNIYIADGYYNTIRKVNKSDGSITTILNRPATAMTVDVAGNLFFANNNQVYRLSPDGTLIIVAGTGSAGNSGDGGAATEATFNDISSLALASTGEIFLSDTISRAVRKINIDGTITTFRNDPRPYLLAISKGDKIFLLSSDLYSTAYSQYDKNGNFISTTITSLPSSITGIAANVNSPNVYFTGKNLNKIYKADLTGNYTSAKLYAGTGTAGFNGEGDGGPALSASISTSSDIFLSAAGELYTSRNLGIRKIDNSQYITTVAGNYTSPGVGNTSGDGLNAKLAGFGNGGMALAKDPEGNIYIADFSAKRVRKINTGQVVSTVAGGGPAGLNENGSAVDATLGTLSGVATNGTNLYIADQSNGRIRVVDGSGTITTIAGGGTTAISTTDFTNTISKHPATYYSFGTNLREVLYQAGKVCFRVGGNVYDIESSGYLKLLYAPASALVQSITGYGNYIYIAYGSGGNASYIMKVNAAQGGYSNLGGSYPGVITSVYSSANDDIYYSTTSGILYHRDVSGTITQLNRVSSPNSSVDGTALSNFSAVSSTSTGMLYLNDGLIFSFGNFLKYVCNSNSIPAASTSSVFYASNTTFPKYLIDGCTIYTGIQPSGNSPVSGIINSQVTVNPAVPVYNNLPYVQRSYAIQPVTDPVNSTATLTVFFTQQEFDNYNLVRGALPALPTGPTDSAGISHVTVSQFHQTGSSPVNGVPVIIDPDDSKITWNASASRWEVTFDINGFSSFFVQSYPVYTFLGAGSWDNANNWASKLKPSLPLPEGAQIIIDPANGECIVDGPVNIPPGSSLIVKPGKKMVIAQH